MKITTSHRLVLKSILCAAAALVLLVQTAGCSLPDNVVEQFAQEPIFSAGAGFYDNEFTLTLSGGWGNDIYYTLDGSDPRTSDTADRYTEGIRIYDNTNMPNFLSAVTDITLNGYYPPDYPIDKGMTVRAAVRNEQGEFGPVVSNSYFVGKSAPFYSELTVISMVTDSELLFHPDTGAYMIGARYYEWKNSDDYVAYDPGDVLNVTNYNADGRESEFPVSIQVFENGRPVYSADVGARIAGNWSRSSAQKSFRFYARREYGAARLKYPFFDDLTDNFGRPIVSFDKITLRNGGNDNYETHFRDALIHDLAKDLACDVMAAQPCILFINGEFWGFYMIREKTDGAYIESHYGIAEEDVAVIKNGGVEEGTDEDLEDFREFCIWAATADMTQEENFARFCELADVQSLMDYVTVETYINNKDWANGYANNWIAWHTRTVTPNMPGADGKWRFILYDTEFSSGIYDDMATQYDYDLLGRMNVGGDNFDIPGIVRNLCKNDGFRQRFYDNYLRVMDTCFEPGAVIAKIDEYSQICGEAIKASRCRFGAEWAANGYDEQVMELKNYFICRPKYAERYLEDFCKR